MHISIEGMDGSGKTSTAKRVAEILDYEFIEKPLHLITDKDNHLDNYMKVIGKVNQMNPKFRARFYWLGNYLVADKVKGSNVVTDRHLVSNYYWNCIDDEKYFSLLVSECGAPDITFILYVSENERKRRIALRNSDDHDLYNNLFDDTCYKRMEFFLKKYKMNYYFIDSNTKGLDEVVNEIVGIIKIHITLTKYDKDNYKISTTAINNVEIK